jgi:hypothetical protein
METILSINAPYLALASTSTSTADIESTLGPRIITPHEEIMLDTLDAKETDAGESIEMPYLPNSSASSSARPIIPAQDYQPLGLGIPLGLGHGLGVDLENIPPAAALVDPATKTVATEAPDIANTTQSKAQRRIGRVQLVSIRYAIFVCGWNDGSTGALLPRIQKVYLVRHLISCFLTINNVDVFIIQKVDFVIVSLLFVMSCVVRCVIFGVEEDNIFKMQT